jgi:hypothetical protein
MNEKILENARKRAYKLGDLVTQPQMSGGMKKDEFIDHLKDANVRKVALHLVEETRIVTDGDHSFGVVSGTLFGVAHRTYDQRGDSMKYFLEKTDFHHGAITEEEHQNYRERNIHAALRRSLEVAVDYKKSVEVRPAEAIYRLI